MTAWDDSFLFKTTKITAAQLNALIAYIKAHKSQHVFGGADAIKLDDFDVPDDTSDLDSTISRHGLCPKLSNSIVKFLRGDGTWAVPSGAAGIAGSTGSTDRAILIANGVGGVTIQGSGVLITSDNSMNVPTGGTYQINGTDLAATDVGAASVSYVTEVSGNLNDVSNYAIEVSGNLGDVSNYAIEVSGNLGDVSNYAIEVSGNLGEKIGGTLGTTDNAIPRANGVGGLTAQASSVTIDDSDNINLSSGIEFKKNLTVADHTFSGTIASLKAHEAFTIYQVGYINASGELALSDADASANMPVRAMAAKALGTDTSGNCILNGFVRHDAWTWTPGGAIYASGTPGAMTQTCPSGTGKIVQILGYAISPTIIRFSPDNTYLELA